MATIFELITMLAVLALGFVLGRIFEIRRELQRDQRIANRQRRSHSRRLSIGSLYSCLPRIFDGARLQVIQL